jgi:hypothetical protein
MALAVAYFDLDASQYLNLASTQDANASGFIIEYFTDLRLNKELQKASLKKAILSLDSIDRSAKESLPIVLRSDMDNFLFDRYSIEPEPLLEELLDNFQLNKHYFAINRFTYEIVTTSVRQDSTLRGVASEIFTRDKNKGGGYNTIEGADTVSNISIANDIGGILKDFGADQIQTLQLQLVLHSLLDSIEAEIQLIMLDQSYSVLDSFRISIPIDGEVNPQTRDYRRDEAMHLIMSLNKIIFKLSSKLVMNDERDDGAFYRMFDKIKNLHDQKVGVTVGLKVKMIINDNDAGK